MCCTAPFETCVFVMLAPLHRFPVQFCPWTPTQNTAAPLGSRGNIHCPLSVVLCMSFCHSLMSLSLEGGDLLWLQPPQCSHTSSWASMLPQMILKQNPVPALFPAQFTPALPSFWTIRVDKG